MDRKVVILCPNFVRPFVVVPRVVVRVRETSVVVIRCKRRPVVVVLVARLFSINDAIVGSSGNDNVVTLAAGFRTGGRNRSHRGHLA